MLVEMNIYHWLRWWWQLKSKQTPKLQIARLRSVPAPTTMWPRRERRPRCRVRDDRQPRVLPQVRLKTYQHTIWIAPDAKSRKMGKIEATLPKTDVLPFLSQDVRPPFTYAALIRQVDRPNSKPIFFQSLLQRLHSLKYLLAAGNQWVSGSAAYIEWDL